MASSWTELKESLFAAPRCRNGVQLRAAFLEDVSISRDELEPDRFNPLLIARHLERLSEICQNCLALRKEVRDLEILAVKALSDYRLFEETSALDERADQLRLHMDALESEAMKQSAARDRFGDISEVAGGLGLVAEAERIRLTSELVDSRELNGLSGKRWAALRAYQRDYATRYEDDGNAHNFGQRALNLLRMFKQEYSEAAERALALQIGLQTVYGWNVGSLPDTFSIKGLDDFVVWVLQAKRGVGWRSESESIFDVVVPLVQPWAPGSSSMGLMASADFDAMIANGRDNPINLSFDVTNSIFMDKAVRLKGFGLAFGNKFGLIAESGVDSIQTEDSFVRIFASIQPPDQSLFGGKSIKPPELTLGNVCLHQASQPAAYMDDPTVHNIQPTGKWSIQLHPNIVWKEAQRRRLSEGGYQNPIRDLKLFFRAFRPAKIQ